MPQRRPLIKMDYTYPRNLGNVVAEYMIVYLKIHRSSFLTNKQAEGTPLDVDFNADILYLLHTLYLWQIHNITIS